MTAGAGPGVTGASGPWYGHPHTRRRADVDGCHGSRLRALSWHDAPAVGQLVGVDARGPLAAVVVARAAAALHLTGAVVHLHDAAVFEVEDDQAGLDRLQACFARA